MNDILKSALDIVKSISSLKSRIIILITLLIIYLMRNYLINTYPSTSKIFLEYGWITLITFVGIFVWVSIDLIIHIKEYFKNKNHEKTELKRNINIIKSLTEGQKKLLVSRIIDYDYQLILTEDSRDLRRLESFNVIHLISTSFSGNVYEISRWVVELYYTDPIYFKP